jgi:predicted phage terminase large subunit-like protein
VVGIESTAYQVVLAEELMFNSTLPVRELHPHKDKVTRAMQLSAYIEAGRVKFDRYRHQDLIRQLLDFPMGAHDDLVDALGYAVAMAIEASDFQQAAVSGAAFTPYSDSF